MNINGFAGWHMSDLYQSHDEDLHQEESQEEGIFVMEDIFVEDSTNKENETINSPWNNAQFGD